MGKGTDFWQRLAAGTDIHAQPLPGVPIVELAGDRRVLIENHFGVTEYSRERIGVKVKYGAVIISGSCLELAKISREQLVVCGHVEAVTLERRG